MLRFLQYYSRFQSVRGNVGGLPSWGRTLLFIIALPGIVLVALSILAFLVSLLALLLLTVPVYRLLVAMTGSRHDVADPTFSVETAEPNEAPSASPRRHIEVKIVE